MKTKKKKHMACMVLALITLSTLSVAKSYEVQFLINRLDGNISLEKMRLVEGNTKLEKNCGESEFEYRLILKNTMDQTMYETCFNVIYVLLSNPPTVLNATIVNLNLPYIPGADKLEVHANDILMYSYSISEGVCNQNGVCENKQTNHAGMFENHVSCPNDCDRYAHDGICNKKPGALYGFNDGFCDMDCPHDRDKESSVGGECFKPNCNDGIQNQDETGVDEGGVCEPPKGPGYEETTTTTIITPATLDEEEKIPIAPLITVFIVLLVIAAKKRKVR